MFGYNWCCVGVPVIASSYEGTFGGILSNAFDAIVEFYSWCNEKNAVTIIPLVKYFVFNIQSYAAHSLHHFYIEIVSVTSS